MRRKSIWVWLMLCVLALAACGGAAAESYRSNSTGGAAFDYDEYEVAAEEAPMADIAYANEDGVATNPATTDTTLAQNQTVERLIIRNGTLNIVVTDTEDAMQEISQLAQQRDGWVVSSNVYDYYPDGKQGTVFIRVPVTQFDAVMVAIKEMATEVSSESTSSDDVTDQYVDLSARLSNLEATAERVRSFLDESQNVEEALAVNQELSRLEGEIEVLKGQIQYLTQSAAYSSITINLTPDIVSQPVTVPGWRPQGVAKEALENLVATLQNIASFIIYFVISVLPLLLLFGLPVYLLVRWGVRRRRRAAAVSQPSSS